MGLSEHGALQLSARLLAGSLLVQAFELWNVRDACDDDGIWREETLREAFSALPAPVRWLVMAVLPSKRWEQLLQTQLLLALLTMLLGASLLLVPLAVGALLIGLRFRGSYNGGSDAMTLLTVLCLTVATCVPALQLACLTYLAVQTALSYLLAGGAKLLQPSWRKGDALSRFAALERYTVPAWAQRMLARDGTSRALGAAVVAFECSFPLAFLGARASLLYLSVGVLFHVANAALFGLNRFLLAWLSAYPAVYFLSGLGPFN